MYTKQKQLLELELGKAIKINTVETMREKKKQGRGIIQNIWKHTISKHTQAQSKAKYKAEHTEQKKEQQTNDTCKE